MAIVAQNHECKHIPLFYNHHVVQALAVDPVLLNQTLKKRSYFKLRTSLIYIQNLTS